MTRLLVLEADANAGPALLLAARRLGAETHVATPADQWDDYPDALRELVDVPVPTDFSDLDAARRRLVEYGREAGVDGVVTGWEFFSALTTRVAAELGLPGHDPDRADAVRSKRAMAEAFELAGAPAPRTVWASGADALAARIDEAGIDYPLVVKPVENAGSIGVSVVSDPDGLGEAVALAQGWPTEFPHGTPLDTAVVAQEYVGGPEFSVESAVVGGRVHHLAVTAKRTTGDRHRAELGHTVPARLDDADRAALLDAVEAGVDALGLRHGIAHAEVKLPAPGVARLIEIGARPPGDHILTLVRLATGVDEAAVYVALALGREPDLRPTDDRAAGVRFIVSPEAGTLRGVAGLPPVAEPVAELVVAASAGDRLGAPSDNTARVGHLIVVGETPDAVDEVADGLLDGIRLEVEPA
jgi:biotin carboxylase